ncbi:hypothetical protein PGT21_030818 [Puccinia graminis f. sp. tritici]|uniref:Uncharacterized protein n=1 Tax=Puccinia graminis f. sp. tritici TaxID=56615 RepID=A0A5B0PLS4_PUCGR|nr:hypothetical protein PGT21_030818 [Puccinia graminis f. sp. tritici]
MFSLSTLEAGVAQEILQISPANQQAAMVYSAVSIHGKASQTQASLSDVHPIGVTKVQKIRLGNLIKTNLRNFVQKTLMECKLDTYSLEHNTDTGEIVAASLLRMKNKFIADLSAHDKKSLLPTGFIDRNQAVLQAVREQIQETIKYKKGTHQGCCFEVRSGDVPTISKLYNHIQQHLPYGGEFSAPNKISLIAQVQFAYMQLEMIIYALGTSSARAAQWGPIDKQLQYLETKGADYFIVWSNLIIQNDKYFFGSPKKFAQIQLDVSVLPTKDNIQQAMATSCNRRAGNNT